MKKLLLIAVFLGAIPLASRAKTVAIPQKMKALKWPTMKQGDYNFYVAQVSALQYLLRRQGFYKRPLS